MIVKSNCELWLLSQATKYAMRIAPGHRFTKIQVSFKIMIAFTGGRVYKCEYFKISTLLYDF